MQLTYVCLSSGCNMQANDFGSEVIPGAKDLGMHVQAYLYDGYWEDIGTIEAFYNANLALTKNPKPDYRSTPLHDLHTSSCEPTFYNDNNHFYRSTILLLLLQGHVRVAGLPLLLR